MFIELKAEECGWSTANDEGRAWLVERGPGATSHRFADGDEGSGFCSQCSHLSGSFEPCVENGLLGARKWMLWDPNRTILSSHGYRDKGDGEERVVSGNSFDRSPQDSPVRGSRVRESREVRVRPRGCQRQRRV